MELLTLPLAFGNITLATLTLLVALAVLVLFFEIGIWIIKKTLALDTEDAPDVKLKNPLTYLRLPVIGFFVCKRENGCYIIRNMIGFRWGDSGWTEYDSSTRTFSTKQLANTYINENFKNAVYSPIAGLMFCSFVIDIIILLLQISFMPTLCITLTLTSMFCIRTLAKKFYSGMKKHSARLDGHDKSIDELKSK